MTTRAYINDLIDTVLDLFAGGINDPSAEQIVKAYYSGRQVTDVMVEDARRKLPRIRRLLDAAGHQVCPLSQTYYGKFRRGRTPITGVTDARRCLPQRAHPETGLLRLSQDANDVQTAVWAAYHGVALAQARGKALKHVTNVRDAVGRELIQPKVGEQMIGWASDRRELTEGETGAA